MRYASHATTAALTLTVLGMMFVIGGVLIAGLFMAGVVLIGLGFVAFAAAGVLHMRGGDVSDGARPET